jgi:hypothetical protein
LLKYCTIPLLTPNVQCWGSLIAPDHLLYRVTPLKTPFGLVIPLLQSQSHVTTITIIYYAVTRLHHYNPYTVVTTITYYTLTHLHWLTSQLSITISNYHTLPVSVSYRDLTRRTAPYKTLSYSCFLKIQLLRHFNSAYKPSIILAALLPVARSVS